MAKSAKYKPVIIFLTDGKHMNDWGDPKDGGEPRDGRFMVGDVVKLCHEARPTIYVFVIKIGDEVLDPTNLGYLNTLANIEVGKDGAGNPAKNFWNNIMSSNELEATYSYIADVCGTVGYPKPCEVQWKTECDGGGELKLNFPNHNNLTASATFTIPDAVKPHLNTTSNPVDFINDNPPTPTTKTVILKAEKNFVEVWGYSSPDPRYRVINWGSKGSPTFTLNKGESTTITLEYTPSDSSFSATNLEILGTACTGRIINITGMMTPFAAPIDMGDTTINISKDKIVTTTFCNRTGKPVRVTSINFRGGDGPLFTKKGFAATTLQNGECLTVTFSFKPLTTGPKQATVEIVTDVLGTITTTIRGNGTGNAGITSANPVVIQNNDCKFLTRDSIIAIKNTGPVVLNISSASITPSGEFSFSPDPLQVSIKANDSTLVTIHFAPKSAGTKNATMTVTSDAVGNEQYPISLEGTMDSVNYEPNSYTFNLGTVCMGTPKDTIIRITNTGTKDLTIQGATVPPNLTLNPASLDIAKTAAQDLAIRYNPVTEGPINDDLILTDAYCNWQKTIKITGTVYDPKVNVKTIVMSSTQNTPYDSTITITNTSATNNLMITSITPSDTQFQFIGSVPQIPTAPPIPPGGTIRVTLRYTPTNSTPVDTPLVLSGMPCKDVNIQLIGNPGLAMADLFIDKYSDLIGKVVPIKVEIRNANQVAESKAQTLSFDLTYDSRLLAQSGSSFGEIPSGTNKIMSVTTPILSTNADQVPITLNMLVLDGGAVVQTPLAISNAKVNSNNVTFKPVDGEFTVKVASSKLTTKDYTARPGEEFDVTVYQSNAVNMDSFHENIQTEVKFNATLLEPVGSTQRGTVVNGERIVPLDAIPVSTSTQEAGLKTFRFRAMLGNAESTDIWLQNSKTNKGKAVFDETVVGKLTLAGVCKDANGTVRLFNPNTNALMLSINPNPASSAVELNFELAEPGNTQIWLANVLGNKISELYNENAQSAGKNSVTFSTMNIPDGVYFIIMQTPTQIVKKRLSIIK